MNRKSFLKQSLTLVGASLCLDEVKAKSKQEMDMLDISQNISLIKNVRLETGFERDNVEVFKTNTSLFLAEITDGKISAIKPNNPNAKAFDAKGMLMLPAMQDMHIHLDKTYFGGKWRARSERQRSVKDMIDFEQSLLPELLRDSTRRADLLIKLLQSNGTNFARSHVNIEPTSKLKSLENLFVALQQNADTFGAELVAFPQHGIFYKDSRSYMREAMALGADFVGGVDPYSLDGAIEPTIDFSIQLALDYQKGLDIHLHEAGESGFKTVHYLIDKVLENPSLKGKTFLSHTFVLANLDSHKLQHTIERLAEAQLGIATTVPIGRNMMPIPALLAANVPVYAGTDSVVDHWQPLGTGSMLDKAHRMAELYGMTSEHKLSRCLSIATKGVIPLDDNGSVLWPKVGDEASFTLFASSCSAEVVARNPAVKLLVHRGTVSFLNI